MTTLATAGDPTDPPGALERARRRARSLLVAGAALGSTAVVLTSTVVVIAARDIVEDTALTGIAAAAIVVGVAVGTSLLATIMDRRDKRTGLALGYGIAVVGAVIAVWAVLAASFPALVAGVFLVGFANSSSSLSRYASAEMEHPERRAWAIGLVVWALTIGAIAGPALVPLSASVAEALGAAELAGPLAASALATVVAAVVTGWWLRPDPDELTFENGVPADVSDAGVPSAREPFRAMVRRPAVAIALIAMIAGQVVMVAIMSMTPLHMTDHGHDLSAVGVVISAHMLGMFALSPLSGRLADRIGAFPTLLASMAMLALAAGLSVAAPPDGGTILLLALFALGYGWNLGFVAGSSLLTSGLAPHERTRAQGFSDTLVWGSSALASLGAGVLLAWAGFAALGIVALALVALASVGLLRLRTALRPAGAAGF